jgi:hypothetical protein
MKQETKFEWNDDLVRECFLQLDVSYMGDSVSKQIDKYKQSKQRKPLLTVEGKPLFEGDEFWCVSKKDFSVHKFKVNNCAAYDVSSDIKTLLTEAAARQWLSENKKSISYKELEEYCTDSYGITNNNSKAIYVDNLLNKFKPKP